jgi:hypothetical protein
MVYQIRRPLESEAKAPGFWRYILHRQSLRKDQRQADLSMEGRDQEGEVVDVFLQKKRDGTATKRFLKLCMAIVNLPIISASWCLLPSPTNIGLGRVYFHPE